jgi:hypothetical protein
VYSPKFLEWYYITGNKQIEYPVENIWESIYLEFAKSDFGQEKCDRNFVNAVSNAKKALHLRVEALATAFGWNHIKKRNNFPSKLDFLGQCGIAAPNIIRRINKFRNTVEHDYHLPSEIEAEEYLDIVELYLMATNKITSEFPDGCDAQLMSIIDEYNEEWNYPSEIDIYFPEAQGVFKITHKDKELVKINIHNPDYFNWVSILVRQTEA